MIRQVIISKKAQKSLHQISKYIESKFSINTRIIFMKKFRDSVVVASINPEIFPLALNQKKFTSVLSPSKHHFYINLIQIN